MTDPLIVRLLRKFHKEGTEVYLPIGSLRYRLQRIEDLPDGDQVNNDAHVKAFFSVKPSGTGTFRRFHDDSDAIWQLKRQPDGSFELTQRDKVEEGSEAPLASQVFYDLLKKHSRAGKLHTWLRIDDDQVYGEIDNLLMHPDGKLEIEVVYMGRHDSKVAAFEIYPEELRDWKLVKTKDGFLLDGPDQVDLKEEAGHKEPIIAGMIDRLLKAKETVVLYHDFGDGNGATACKINGMLVNHHFGTIDLEVEFYDGVHIQNDTFGYTFEEGEDLTLKRRPMDGKWVLGKKGQVSEDLDDGKDPLFMTLLKKLLKTGKTINIRIGPKVRQVYDVETGIPPRYNPPFVDIFHTNDAAISDVKRVLGSDKIKNLGLEKSKSGDEWWVKGHDR